MNTPDSKPPVDLLLEAIQGGVFAWFKRADASGQVRLELIRVLGSPSSRRWTDHPQRALGHIPRLLKEESEIGFFVGSAILPHRQLLLGMADVSVRSGLAGMEVVSVNVSLAALLGLPCVNPKEEMREFQTFLLAIRDVVKEALTRGERVAPQVFRVPGDKGVDWVGFSDKALQEDKSAHMRKYVDSRPALRAWRETQLEALKKTGRGPYRWHTMPTRLLFPQSEYHTLLKAAQEKPIAPGFSRRPHQSSP